MSNLQDIGKNWLVAEPMPDFQDTIDIRPMRAEYLHYERFNHRSQLPHFDCGNQGLNDFILRDDEVFRYGEDCKAKTWLVREREGWEVVAYYATYADTLHETHARRTPGVRPRYTDGYWPALTIGRLAVQQGWQGRGIGSLILQKIAIDALEAELCAFRLITLCAEPASVAFYQKMGFIKPEGRKNKGKIKPLMFLDLKKLAQHLGIEGAGQVRFHESNDVDRH